MFMQTHNTFHDKYSFMTYSYVFKSSYKDINYKLANIKIEKYDRFFKELSAPLFHLRFSNIIS